MSLIDAEMTNAKAGINKLKVIIYTAIIKWMSCYPSLYAVLLKLDEKEMSRNSVTDPNNSRVTYYEI